MRNTSLVAYNKIKESGLLSRLRFQVYECMYHHGPLTAGEMWDRFFKPGKQRSSVASRFSELEVLGLFTVIDEVPCKYTGNLSNLYDVTDKIPADKQTLPNKKSNRQIILELRERIRELETEVNQLRSQLSYN